MTPEQGGKIENATDSINNVNKNLINTIENLQKFEILLNSFSKIFQGFSLDNLAITVEKVNGRTTKMSDLIMFTLSVFKNAPELMHLEPQQCTMLEYLEGHNLAYLLKSDLSQELATYTPLDNFLMPNSYINNNLNALVNQGPTEIDTSRQGKKRGRYSIKCAVRINADLFPPTFSPLDRLVFNGACTLFEAGRTYFTPLHIYNAFSGMNLKHLRPELSAQIVDSIEKQATTLVKIDATAEMQARGFKGKKFYLKGNCLAIKGFEATAHGQVIEAYTFLAEPILLTYSKALKQVITVDRKLLQVTDSNGKLKRNTLQFSIVKQYLLQRVEIMHRQKGKARGQKGYNHIKALTFYENVGANTRKEQRRAYRQAVEVLNYWQQVGYIQKWSEDKAAKNFNIEL